MDENDFKLELVKKLSDYICTRRLTRSEDLLLQDFVSYVNSWGCYDGEK